MTTSFFMPNMRAQASASERKGRCRVPCSSAEVRQATLPGALVRVAVSVPTLFSRYGQAVREPGEYVLRSFNETVTDVEYIGAMKTYVLFLHLLCNRTIEVIPRNHVTKS